MKISDLQKIKSPTGKVEYVLLPIDIYNSLQDEISAKLRMKKLESNYVPFVLENYVDNPVALARIKARLSQEELAKRMNVSQSYISKVEAQAKVSIKVLKRASDALKK